MTIVYTIIIINFNHCDIGEGEKNVCFVKEMSCENPIPKQGLRLLNQNKVLMNYASQSLYS